MSIEIINTRKELYDLSSEGKFNELYDYSEVPPQILDTVFCGPKLTSINNFFNWWRWLTTTVKSFQCDIDYKELVKNGDNGKRFRFSYFTEVLIKSLLLNSIINDKNGTNFWKSRTPKKLTSSEIILSVLENYSFILPHEEIKLLNSNFTLDKNVKSTTKCKEWRRLQFINEINDYQWSEIQIISNLRLYAIENNLDYEGIDDIKVPIVLIIKKFYQQLRNRNLSTNQRKNNPMNKTNNMHNNGLRNYPNPTNNINSNKNNVILKNGKPLPIHGSKKIKKRFKAKKKKINVDKKGNNSNNQELMIKKSNNGKVKPESEVRSICQDCHGRHKTKLCPNLAKCPKCNIRHPSQMPVCPSKKTNRKFKKKYKRKGKKEP